MTTDTKAAIEWLRAWLGEKNPYRYPILEKHIKTICAAAERGEARLDWTKVEMTTDELREKLEQSEADTKRLDWLGRQAITINISDEQFWFIGDSAIKSLREAIDAAMKGEK